ncbi:hypothetical protein Tco_0676111 [Tanacetum coccineum]
MISSQRNNSGGRNLPWLDILVPKGCVEGDTAAAVWCKTIIDHHHHIAAVTVAASQLSRTHGGLESLKWVAIRWAVTSPAIVQQRTRYLR